MSVTNLNVTGKLNVATNASINNLAASKLNATDISANTLNLNNFTIDTSGNTYTNSLNVNQKYIIDSSGKYLSKNTSGNLIGIRKFRYALYTPWTGSDVYYKIFDSINTDYNEANWYLEVNGSNINPGQYNVTYGTKLFAAVSNNDNKWYLIQGTYTAQDGNENDPLVVYVTAYPRNMFEVLNYAKVNVSSNVVSNKIKLV